MNSRPDSSITFKSGKTTQALNKTARNVGCDSNAPISHFNAAEASIQHMSEKYLKEPFA